MKITKNQREALSIPTAIRRIPVIPLEPVRPLGRPKSNKPDYLPVLRFTPTAWAKLLYFRDKGPTEIGGFGISSASDLLRIEDFASVKQAVTVASVSFDDDAVADFFDRQVDVCRRPEQFARIWLHTHPGDSPTPSGTDEETFARVFGRCQWAVMFILARNGTYYARMHFSVGPGGQILIPVEIDYSQPFGQSDHIVWEAEYQTNIKTGKSDIFGFQRDDWSLVDDLYGHADSGDWLEELEAMEPAERQLVMEELAARPNLWDDGEVDNVY